MSLFKGLFTFGGDVAAVSVEHAAESAMTAFAAVLPNITSAAGLRRANELLEGQREKFIEAQKAYKAELANDAEYTVPFQRASVAMQKLKTEAAACVDEGQKAAIMVRASVARPEYDKRKAAYEEDQARNARVKARMDRAEAIYKRMKADLDRKQDELAAVKDALSKAEDRKVEAEMDLREEQALAGLSDHFDASNAALSALKKAADEADTEARVAEQKVAEMRNSNNAVSEGSAIIAEVLGEDKPKFQDPFEGI